MKYLLCIALLRIKLLLNAQVNNFLSFDQSLTPAVEIYFIYEMEITIDYNFLSK